MLNFNEIPKLNFHENETDKFLDDYNNLLQNKFIVQAIISYVARNDYRDYELLPFIETLLMAADLIDEPIRRPEK